MNLILWRHADAEAGSPDAERALTPLGHRQAARMADWLRAHLPAGALLLVSPARRAQQTAQALHGTFETVAALGTSAAPPDIVRAAQWPARGGTLVVVGHQPVLGAVAALLLTGTSAPWHLKKGGLIWLQYRAEDGESPVRLRAALSSDLL